MDGVEIVEFHPAVAHTVRQRSVTHRLFDDARQSVRRADFLLLESGQHKRAAHARLHRMEVAEFPAPYLVHPDPFPGRAEVHDLLAHMAQAAPLYAGGLESLGGAGGKVTRRLIGLGPQAGAQVQMGGPVVSRWLVHHGAPILRVWSRGEIGRDRGGAHTTVGALPYARRHPSSA